MTKELVLETGLTREKGYLYYLSGDMKIYRSKMSHGRKPKA